MSIPSKIRFAFWFIAISFLSLLIWANWPLVVLHPGLTFVLLGVLGEVFIEEMGKKDEWKKFKKVCSGLLLLGLAWEFIEARDVDDHLADVISTNTVISVKLGEMESGNWALKREVARLNLKSAELVSSNLAFDSKLTDAKAELAKSELKLEEVRNAQKPRISRIDRRFRTFLKSNPTGEATILYMPEDQGGLFLAMAIANELESANWKNVETKPISDSMKKMYLGGPFGSEFPLQMRATGTVGPLCLIAQKFSTNTVPAAGRTGDLRAEFKREQNPTLLGDVLLEAFSMSGLVSSNGIWPLPYEKDSLPSNRVVIIFGQDW